MDSGAIGQAEHALHIWPEWTLNTETRPDHLLVRFTRRRD